MSPKTQRAVAPAPVAAPRTEAKTAAPSHPQLSVPTKNLFLGTNGVQALDQTVAMRSPAKGFTAVEISDGQGHTVRADISAKGDFAWPKGRLPTNAEVTIAFLHPEGRLEAKARTPSQQHQHTSLEGSTFAWVANPKPEAPAAPPPLDLSRIAISAQGGIQGLGGRGADAFGRHVADGYAKVEISDRSSGGHLATADVSADGSLGWQTGESKPGSSVTVTFRTGDGQAVSADVRTPKAPGQWATLEELGAKFTPADDE